MRTSLPLLPLIIVLAGLAGCAQNPPAPVVDLTTDIPAAGARSADADAPLPARDGEYVVRPGDTLYSIAFRQQLDWKALAFWNGIESPYRIVPGQRLRLDAPPPGEGGSTAATFAAGPAHEEAVMVAPAATPEASTAPVAPPPVATAPEPAPAPVAPPERAAPPATPEQPARSARQRTVGGVSWQWPTDGAVERGYVGSDPSRQGLDIEGRRGDPVHAAASGVVVYSGNALVGYGELVIIKHSDTYLSAYAHNDTRLVNEGDQVRAGQAIATMGSTGTSRTRLHFEIREHGQPLDPLGFLPPR